MPIAPHLTPALARHAALSAALIAAVSLTGCATTPTQDTSRHGTDASLGWKATGKQVASASSQTGDLWDELLHHGPAVENPWAGYRFYFNDSIGVDAYNKRTVQMELAETGWYTPPEREPEGYGQDVFFVGPSLGLGSIRLWDGSKPVNFENVENRIARVSTEGSIAQIDMVSRGVPFDGREITVMHRLTVFADQRHARVEAFVMADEPVRLVTGVVKHPDMNETQADNYIATWGIHPPTKRIPDPDPVGAGLVFDPDDFERVTTSADNFLLVTSPTHYLRVWVTTSWAHDPEGIDDAASFSRHVKQLAERLTAGRK